MNLSRPTDGATAAQLLHEAVGPQRTALRQRDVERRQKLAQRMELFHRRLVMDPVDQRGVRALQRLGIAHRREYGCVGPQQMQLLHDAFRAGVDGELLVHDRDSHGERRRRRDVRDPRRTSERGMSVNPARRCRAD